MLEVPVTAVEPVEEQRDLTPGDRDAYPTSTTFSVGDDFTFSPDGKYLVYTAPPERDEAWSTNYNLWRVPVAGGPAECLTRDNPAANGAASPDMPAGSTQTARRTPAARCSDAKRAEAATASASARSTVMP